MVAQLQKMSQDGQAGILKPVKSQNADSREIRTFAWRT